MCLALVTWCAHVSVMGARGVGMRDADMSCADRGASSITLPLSSSSLLPETDIDVEDATAPRVIDITGQAST